MMLSIYYIGTGGWVSNQTKKNLFKEELVNIGGNFAFYSIWINVILLVCMYNPCCPCYDHYIRDDCVNETVVHSQK